MEELQNQKNAFENFQKHIHTDMIQDSLQRISPLLQYLKKNLNQEGETPGYQKFMLFLQKLNEINSIPRFQQEIEQKIQDIRKNPPTKNLDPLLEKKIKAYKNASKPLEKTDYQDLLIFLEGCQTKEIALLKEENDLHKIEINIITEKTSYSPLRPASTPPDAPLFIKVLLSFLREQIFSTNEAKDEKTLLEIRKIFYESGFDLGFADRFLTHADFLHKIPHTDTDTKYLYYFWTQKTILKNQAILVFSFRQDPWIQELEKQISLMNQKSPLRSLDSEDLFFSTAFQYFQGLKKQDFIVIGNGIQLKMYYGYELEKARGKVAIFSVDLLKMIDFIQTRTSLLILLLLLVFPISMIFLFLIGQRFTKNLKIFEKIMSDISRGEIPKKAVIPGGDEFSRLAEILNHLLFHLEKRKKILSFLDSSLNQMDQDQTGKETENIVNTSQFGSVMMIHSSNLDKLLEEIQTIVHHNCAKIDKLLENSLLVFFTHPDVSSHVMKILNSSFFLANKHQLHLSMATGEMIIGRVGSPNRQDFTCIGPVVNLSARLKALAIKDGHFFLTDEITAKKIPLPAKALEKINIKGLLQPITVYSIETKNP